MTRMHGVQKSWPVNAAPQERKRSRLAAALGVERRTLADVLAEAQHNLYTLRAMTLTDLQRLVSVSDAERVFYLVQWEYLQAHLELYGTLPDKSELEPLLATLTPIFERHFSRSTRLNETLLALYRAELSARNEDTCLSLTPPSLARQFLRRFSQQFS